MPMQAVIVLAGENPEMHPLNERTPAPMLHVLDRPFIQHVVESLVAQGVLNLDLILCHQPEKIEGLFEDGTRWGCSIRYHLARDPERPYRHIRALRFDTGQDYILLAHGDRFLHVNVADSRPTEPDAESVLFCTEPDGDGDRTGGSVWTGWAWMSAAGLRDLPAEADEAELRTFLMSGTSLRVKRINVEAPLGIRTFEEMLTTNWKILEMKGAGLLLSGRETDPGVWISRNVSLHPMAHLVPPVYIGENCRIGLGVKLGPGVVLGRDSALDKRCTVENSVIMPGSYVGEALELADVIVDRNRLVNVRVGAAVTVADDFILGSLKERRIQNWLLAVSSRSMGALLLLICFPALLLTALLLKLRGRNPVLFREEAVCLPAPEDASLWKSFQRYRFNDGSGGPGEGGSTNKAGEEGREGVGDLFLRFLPALLNIVQGEMRFVGVRPRTREETASLPPDWRTLYLTSKPGVVTEAYAVYGSDPSPDERYSAEAFYSASSGFTHDVRLLLRYLRRTLGGTRPLSGGRSRSPGSASL